MNIPSNSVQRVRVCDPIPQRVLEEFPDLEDAGPSFGSSLGVKWPETDQAYIDKKIKRLSRELKKAPGRMKVWRTLERVTGSVMGVSAVLGALSPVGVVGAVAAGSAACAAFAGACFVGLVACLPVMLLDDAVVDKIHDIKTQYYQDRTELAHLQKQEGWAPAPSFIPPVRSDP